MDMPGVPRQVADGDTTSLFYVARAIMKLQLLYGEVKHMKAKGDASSDIVDMLRRMRESMGRAPMGDGTSQIDTLILLDRSCDMVTPLLTPLTYEGLIDENMHISNGSVVIDGGVIVEERAGKKMKVRTHSTF